jgi:hypothetical protein
LQCKCATGSNIKQETLRHFRLTQTSACAERMAGKCICRFLTKLLDAGPRIDILRAGYK